MQKGAETWRSEDAGFMRLAIAEANLAAGDGEVPIGAVAVVGEKVVGKAHNVRERTHNPLGHAEILLMESLAKGKGSWRLEDTAIYVTCEPCLMCAGAMLQARIPRVVYGCADPKGGAFGSVYDVSNDPRLSHRIEVAGGVLADECAALLSDFFKKLRKPVDS